VDIIDFDYPYWHTAGDTIDKISPTSLERQGVRCRLAGARDAERQAHQPAPPRPAASLAAGWNRASHICDMDCASTPTRHVVRAPAQTSVWQLRRIIGL
jgi:hypothetical protein